MIVYVESSAAAKLLLEATESAALATYLDERASEDTSLVAGTILETELRRLATRVDVPQEQVTQLLARLDLVEIDSDLHRDAGLLPGRFLRSLDAIHIAVARRVNAEVMVTYDHRQRTGAESVGLKVEAPGS